MRLIYGRVLRLPERGCYGGENKAIARVIPHRIQQRDAFDHIVGEIFPRVGHRKRNR